jgi:hypothetical protein
MASFETTWQAPEFEYRSKDISWYWISIIVASIIVAFAVWEKNFLFGFFVVIAEILFVTWGNVPPRTVSFSLSDKGLEINNGKLHAMNTMESFSVDSLDDAWTELIFSFRAKLRTPLRVIIPADTVEEVRKNLKGVLKEVEYEPSLLDSLEKLIRF